MTALLILFLIGYSIAVFLIKNLWVLLGFTIFNLLLLIITRISPRKLAKNTLAILPFLIIVFLFNLIFDSVVNSLIVIWRIFIVTNFCFIFSVNVSPANLANGFTTLLCPLKLFKVNTERLGIMLTIAFNFIPILRAKAGGMKKTLKVRHAKITPKNLIQMLTFMFSMFFVELIKMSNELERAMLARNYSE